MAILSGSPAPWRDCTLFQVTAQQSSLPDLSQVLMTCTKKLPGDPVPTVQNLSVMNNPRCSQDMVPTQVSPLYLLSSSPTTPMGLLT